MPHGLTAGRQQRPERLPSRFEEGATGPRPKAESPATTGCQPFSAEPRKQFAARRGPNLEQALGRREQASAVILRAAGAQHHTMGRQHRERFVRRVEKERQDVIERWVFLARPAHPTLLAVA